MSEKKQKGLDEERLPRSEAELAERLKSTNSMIKPEPEPSLTDKVLGTVFGPLYWRAKNAPRRRDE